MATKKSQDSDCPPKTPRNVEQLKRLLTRAIELEHILMSAYLFTAYSLRQDPSEGGFCDDDETLRKAQVKAVLSWRSQISGVAIQEMLHMALAGNMLSAIGGEPTFGRKGLSFPISPKTMMDFFGYDGKAWLGLWPFSELTIKRYVWFEAFEHEEFPGPPYESSPPRLRRPKYLQGLEDMEVSSLVELYEAIARGFIYLNKNLGPKKLFPPERRNLQVTDQEVTGLFNFPPALTPEGKPRPLLRAVTNLHTALIAINTIIVQGEGDTTEWEQFVQSLKITSALKVFPQIRSQSHHDTFRQILLGTPAVCGTNPSQVKPASPGYYELRLEHPDFQPARPVLENPLATDPCDGDRACRRHVHLIRNAFTKRVAKLFDELYDTLINILALGYAQQGCADDSSLPKASVQAYAKATLIQSSIRAMVYIVAPLGNTLTQLPGNRKESWFAGPGFVFQDQHGDWDAVADRLAELAQRARRLSRDPSAERKVWITPAYLGIPARKKAFPRESLATLLCERLAPDLLFMSDRLRRVEGNAPNPDFDLHVCQGLNACAGQDITGTASEAGTGLCATADPHVCSGQNHCKDQGGCGFSPGNPPPFYLQNHPGQNNYPGQVPGPDGFFVFNKQADSACGSPILPSLQNTYGLNTPPRKQRGGSRKVFRKAKGLVWDFARILFEEKMRAEGKPFGDYNGIDRYRAPCDSRKK